MRIYLLLDSSNSEIIPPIDKPRAIWELGTNELAVFLYGIVTGILAVIIYYYRNGKSLDPPRLRGHKGFSYYAILVIPALGIILEEMYAPNDLLTRIAIVPLSIIGRLSLYVLWTCACELYGKRKYVITPLAISALISLFLGLVLIAKRRTVIAFYALARLHTFLRILI
jgi:hypothetical protein